MSSRGLGLGLLLPLLSIGPPASEPPKEPASRTFDATYIGTIAPLPKDAKRVDVWIPIPSDTPHQEVRDLKISTPFPATIGKDSAGNSVAHFTVGDPAALAGKEIEVRVSCRIRRTEDRAPIGVAAGKPAGPPPSELSAYLGENRMVPQTPRVRKLAASLAAGKKGAVEKARAFYDYLVENGTYDKTTPGWGKGDSERFCDIKKGNCTDFHSAFMALARAEGIPVRFVIGFPLMAAPAGTVPGYHCWVEFWDERAGWVPLDASEAAQSRGDRRRTVYLFGNLDPDRFAVSSGRDLTLTPKQEAGPVNFLVYPYVEVDGKAFAATKIRLEYKGV
ncbi:MAG: transglutaminase-like domain-containing protein [Acidithiobacillales bacterium]